jgi:hypothetical protein
MIAALIAAAMLCVLGVVASERAARRYRGRIADAGRVRLQAARRVRERW